MTEYRQSIGSRSSAERLSRRRFLTVSSVALAGLGAAVLAACGQAPSTPTPAAAKPVAPAGAAPTAAAAQPTAAAAAQPTAAAAQPTTAAAPAAAAKSDLKKADLKTWIWWNDPVQSVKDMGANLNKKQPNLTQSVEAPADYWTKLQTALAGGAGPDIYLMNNVNYWSWAYKGVLLELDARLNGSDEAKDFMAHAWKPGVEFYRYKGKYLGVPFMMTSIVMFYNEDALGKAGLKPPAEIEETWTWDTYRDYALKLTKREGDKTTFWGAITTQGMELSWLNFIRSNGADYLNADNTKCVVDQDASVEAFDFLTNMALKDNVSPSPEVLQAESLSSVFATGKLGLWINASNASKTLNTQVKDFKYNYALLPLAPKTKKRAGNTNVVGWVLNKDGKAIDEAFVGLANMLTKDSGDILARADVLRPAREDSAELYYDTKVAGGPANRVAARKMFEWTTPLPTHEKVSWGEMTKPSNDWANQIFIGKVGAKEGLTKAAAEINDLFAKAK